MARRPRQRPQPLRRRRGRLPLPRNRWAHFDTIDAAQASQDVREMQMLLADLGAVDEARRMTQIQRILDLMVRSGRR